MSSLPSAESFAAAAFAAEPEPQVVVSPSAPHTVLAASDSWLRAWRLRRDEVLGRPLFELTQASLSDPTRSLQRAWRAALARAADEGVAVEVGAETLLIARPDADGGGWEAHSWALRYLPLRGDAGEVTAIVQRALPAAPLTLREQPGGPDERTARLLLNSTTEAIWSIDLDGLISFANRAAETTFGYPVDAMLGRRSHPLVHHKRADGTPYPIEECPIYDAFRQGRSIFLDDEVLWRADGSSFLAEYRSDPVLDDGRVVGAVVTFTDVTARREMQRRLQDTVAALNRERDMRELFVAALTHDLRNPLGGAKIATALINRHRTEPEAVQKHAATIASCIERANGMVEDLLDVSRVRAGQRLVLRLSRVELASLLRRTLADLVLVHGDRFISDIQAEAEGEWDATGLRRVIENLASNAIKYGAAGRPIAVAMHSRAGRVELAIHNEGKPLCEADRAAIFEPFHRTAAATQGGQAQSWGIGLAVVHGIVEAHAGSIEVESSADTGTTFTVSLPYAAARPAGRRGMAVEAGD